MSCMFLYHRSEETQLSAGRLAESSESQWLSADAWQRLITVNVLGA